VVNVSKKYPDGAIKTIYVDRDVFRKARTLALEKLGKSISEVINEYLVELVAKLEGSPTQFQAETDYRNIKQQYVKAVDEVRRLTAILQKAGVYGDLKNLAIALGLDFKNLTNAAEVSAKLLDCWTGRQEHVHMFISLLEAAQHKIQLEKRLTEIRKHAAHFSSGVNTVGEADAKANSIQRIEGLPQMRSNDASKNP
jgi:predicted nucleotidyltransferase